MYTEGERGRLENEKEMRPTPDTCGALMRFLQLLAPCSGKAGSLRGEFCRGWILAASQWRKRRQESQLFRFGGVKCTRNQRQVLAQATTEVGHRAADGKGDALQAPGDPNPWWSKSDTPLLETYIAPRFRGWQCARGEMTHE